MNWENTDLFTNVERLCILRPRYTPQSLFHSMTLNRVNETLIDHFKIQKLKRPFIFVDSTVFLKEKTGSSRG
jgi:hypothetical protein